MYIDLNIFHNQRTCDMDIREILVFHDVNNLCI